MLRADDLTYLQQQFAFLGKPVVVLDTEATGGNVFQDRLTEIALVRFDAHGITRYQQLINPQIPISPFIEQLTGIDNQMVAQAPTFAQIVEILADLLQDAVLVAHNSRFDYHFLRLAFKRCQRALSMPQLCSVKLSRQLYPQYFKHNLDSIIERLNIQLPQRHRALADVATLTQFLAHAAREHPDAWQTCIHKLMTPSLPPTWLAPHLAQDIQHLADDCGVVLLWPQDDAPPKVWLCEHMYQDVCTKLKAKSAPQDLSNLRKIEGISCIGPIDAAIVASRYADHSQQGFYTIRFVSDERQQWQAKIQLLRTQHSAVPPFGVFAHPKAAKKALHEWARKHGFCPKQLNILPQTLADSDTCPIQQNSQCHGMCTHIDNQQDLATALHQKARELPIMGWQSKWANQVAEVDLSTGQRKQWSLSGSAVQCDDGTWLWDANVFLALKATLRQGKARRA